jgi:hypothetical protein
MAVGGRCKDNVEFFSASGGEFFFAENAGGNMQRGKNIECRLEWNLRTTN